MAFGFLATLSLTGEMLLSRVLTSRGVDGKFIGLNFLIAEGIIGTACLVVSTALGNGLFLTGVKGTFLLLLAGLTGFLAVGQL
mmetsp:Transcript_25043/g.31346  ORF Transcript_25043/g.31346 Transcript_25043/m.31346 type:complete len:83 (-) Transcript_25043:309-557(-)